jgi:isoamylase
MAVILSGGSAVLKPEISSTANVGKSSGRSAPLGTTVLPNGVNFSVFSRNASGVELLFFDREDDAQPARVITMDPVANRTYNYWHAFVPGVEPGQLLYGYRVQGQFDPASGMRFDPTKLLLDP